MAGIILSASIGALTLAALAVGFLRAKKNVRSRRRSGTWDRK